MAKKSTKNMKKPQGIWWLCFILYIGIMVWLLFVRSQVWTAGLSYQQMLQENINLKPLFTIRNYINVILHYPDSYYYEHCIINLIGNILLFIPAGFLPPRLIPSLKKFFCFLPTVLICLLFVELLQLFALVGSFDVDDIILNLFGILIGYLVFLFSAKNKNL